MLKGSFRAKDPVHRVDQLAIEFNGGGHACAAGFNPGCTLEELMPRLESALENHFKSLNGKS
jgi:phosphoesterase RecJ-like protein